MKLKITIRRWHVTVIHPGSRWTRGFALCATLGHNAFAPAICGYLGEPEDAQGWHHRIIYLRRRPNGLRFMHCVIGGTNPVPLNWS